MLTSNSQGETAMFWPDIKDWSLTSSVYYNTTWQHFDCQVLSSFNTGFISQRQGQYSVKQPSQYFPGHILLTLSEQTWLVARILKLWGLPNSTRACHSYVEQWSTQHEGHKKDCIFLFYRHDDVYTHNGNNDKLARNWPMSSDALVMCLKLHALSGRGTTLLNVSALSHMLSA